MRPILRGALVLQSSWVRVRVKVCVPRARGRILSCVFLMHDRNRVTRHPGVAKSRPPPRCRLSASASRPYPAARVTAESSDTDVPLHRRTYPYQSAARHMAAGRVLEAVRSALTPPWADVVHVQDADGRLHVVRAADASLAARADTAPDPPSPAAQTPQGEPSRR